MSTPISTASFIASLGINTHLDFAAYGYQNVGAVENAIKYLGLVNLRDSPGNAGDTTLWQQVAQATGAKFDAYIGETSPAGMQSGLSRLPQLAKLGILNAIEGGNEEDDAYPASLGNNLAITAQFQQQVWAMGQQLGLPAINMSFGAGWTAANNWHGNYDKVGNLSAFTTYANAHTYPNAGQSADFSIQTLNADARLAAGSRPVVTTELGWNLNQGFSQAQVATYVLDGALDGIKDGDVRTYFYALFNDGAGPFGLMNQNGSPTPAGTALHNLTAILKDTGSNATSFTPGSLNYSLSGTQSGDNVLLMEKSDGSYWLSLWNETAGPHSVTLNLGSAAARISVFNPLSGTNAVRTVGNSGNITLTLPQNPVIVEISGGAAPAAGAVTTSDPATPTPAATPTPTATATPAPTSGATSPQDLALNLPNTPSVASGSTTAISGVAISDPWAASAGGRMALNVWDKTGTLSLAGKTFAPGGQAVPGGMFSGTLAQLNAELASLSYTAPAGGGSDSITVDVWNQAGVESTKSFAVDAAGSTGATTSTAASAPTPTPTPTPTPAATQHSVTIAAGDATPVVVLSNAQVTASAGDHMIFIGATGDVLNATGGTETVQAYQGGNTISTGSGNDTIRYSGSNNVISAGGGNNVLADSGSNSTIVLPGANQGFDDVFGYTMTNGDRFDLRPALSGTGWNGDVSSIGNFVKIATSGNSAVISMDPSGSTRGASYAVARLESSGPLSLPTLLAHSMT